MSDVTHIDSAGFVHVDSCEAEADHEHDCATATRLARLVAFAEAVRDEVECTAVEPSDIDEPDHVADCFHHAALQALEPVR